MQEKIIRKISVDKQTFFDVEGLLDLSTRTLKLNIPLLSFENIFDFKPRDLFLHPEKINMYKIIYVCDNNKIFYTCFNCIFGFKYTDPINIYSAPIDCIFENTMADTNNIDINKLSFVTTLPRKFSSYIANIDFKYTKSKSISIGTSLDNDKVIINYSAISLKKIKYNKLSEILYSLLELTFLYLGDIPKIENIIVYDEENINIYIESAPKYIQRKNIYNSSSNGILSYLDANYISSKLLRDFISFRKKTKILYDMLMINMNGNGYLEITNSMLVQLLEGLYKTINPSNNKKLREILNFYYMQNPTIKTLLVKRDLKDAGDIHHTPIFLLKAKEHRHYLSHLNMNQSKKVFFKLENNYAYWKLCHCIRIYIMQLLGIPINIKEFNNTKNSIEKWAKDHHLRYKK